MLIVRSSLRDAPAALATVVHQRACAGVAGRVWNLNPTFTTSAVSAFQRADPSLVAPGSFNRTRDGRHSRVTMVNNERFT